MEILYGSLAIKNYFGDFRENNDIDYIVKEPKKRYKNIEYSCIGPIWKYYDGVKLTPNQLYTIKVSHIFWDIKYNKHINDISFLQRKNCSLIKELFNDLYQYWEIKHGLNVRDNINIELDDFNNLSIDNKYQLIYSLSYPYIKNSFSKKLEFTRTLKLLIQNKTPIWLGIFIIENYNDLINKFKI